MTLIYIACTLNFYATNKQENEEEEKKNIYNILHVLQSIKAVYIYDDV